MKTVHKHIMTPHSGDRDIELTAQHHFLGAEFITHCKEIWIWVEVDTDPSAQRTTAKLRIIRSGDAMPNDAEHCGTAIDQYHGEAYHVYCLAS